MSVYFTKKENAVVVACLKFITAALKKFDASKDGSDLHCPCLLLFVMFP